MQLDLCPCIQCDCGASNGNALIVISVLWYKAMSFELCYGVCPLCLNLPPTFPVYAPIDYQFLLLSLVDHGVITVPAAAAVAAIINNDGGRIAGPWWWWLDASIGHADIANDPT